MQLSPVQDHIISKLKNADTLRYSQMKPVDTPNDLYNYHLKFLISKSLIMKQPNGYTLSHEGRRYVADKHHTSDQFQRLFKINVITIVSKQTDDGLLILNQIRGSQPSYGKIGIPGGTIIKGEPLLDGASRKLTEETGLSADFKLIGHERRMQYQNDELFSDILFPICYSSEYTGTLTDTEYGSNIWSPIDEAINHEKDPHDSIASIVTVLTAIKDGNINHLPQFYNETVQK